MFSIPIVPTNENMPSSYTFGDAKSSDAVSRALLLVAKFSRKQAIVKFSGASVSVIWATKSYYVHAEAPDVGMFDGSVHKCIIVQVDPTVLGRTLRPPGTQSPDRRISLTISRPNRIQVVVEYNDRSARTITHTFPCDIKSKEDYELMCIDKIQNKLCQFNTRSYIDPAYRLRHILDSFVRLATPKVYIQSRQIEDTLTNSIQIIAKNQGSIVDVYLTELVDGREELVSKDNEYDQDDAFKNPPLRNTAGVHLDPRKLALFFNLVPKWARVCMDIEHNKCLKVTLDSVPNEPANEKKLYMSFLLMHNLDR